jgi:membrane-bound serine protease (ClpP class)
VTGFQRRHRTIFYLLAAISIAMAPVASEARENSLQKGDVVVVPLSGEIAPSLFLFLRRAEKAAEKAGAAAIIFEMNTYGGRLDTAEEITGVLNHATIPTYTFVNPNAGSAGALIALATNHIYMAPVSAIGAAAPVLSTGEDLPTTSREKTVSYWSALVRGSAIRNGHNPDVGEAFIDKEKEVKVGDRVVHPKGSLLTLNAQEATEQIAGKPVLADGIADSVADLMRKAGLKGDPVAFNPTGFERLASWITVLAPLLLLGGIVGAYLEFKIPGVSLPGVLSVICFALFFAGHYLAGLAGWEVFALFGVGVLFVLIEVLFFAHSTIVFGVVGVLLMFGSLLWAMIDRYPGQRFVPTGEMLAIPAMNLFIAAIASAAAIAVLARYLPRTSIYRRFALMSAIPSGPSLAGIPREFANAVSLAPGTQGTALTTLRPSGKASFGTHVVDVVTEGEFVAAETPVAVIQSDGMRVVVKGVIETQPSRA